MKEFLKKNWFVAIIAVFFIVVSIVYSVNTAKNQLPTKTVDGKQVVFELGGKYFNADEVYDEMYKSYGKQKLFIMFKDEIVNQLVKVDDNMQNEITNAVLGTIQYYQNNYGQGESYLNQLAKYYYGYNSFRDYVTASIKMEHYLKDYVQANSDELVTDELIEESKPRIVSYCLIKFDDPENPTEEEKAKLEEAKAAWGKDYNADTFAEFAKKFSQDTSTASNGGKLGYCDANSSLYEEFKKQATALKEGECSDFFFDEQAGYFIIKCDSTKYEDYKNETDFLSTVLAANDGLAEKVLWAKAEELGYSFADKEIEEYVKSSFQHEHDHDHEHEEGEED